VAETAAGAVIDTIAGTATAPTTADRFMNDRRLRPDIRASAGNGSSSNPASSNWVNARRTMASSIRIPSSALASRARSFASCCPSQSRQTAADVRFSVWIWWTTVS
jgi:hypothetical protein